MLRSLFPPVDHEYRPLARTCRDDDGERCCVVAHTPFRRKREGRAHKVKTLPATCEKARPEAHEELPGGGAVIGVFWEVQRGRGVMERREREAETAIK